MTKIPKPLKQPKNPVTEVRHVGQPTKYRPEYDDLIITWFSQDVVKEVTEVMEGKNWQKNTTKYEPVFFPTFEEFAAIVVGVDDDTLVEWSKVHKSFSAAYRRAKSIQKAALLRYTMLGRLDSRFAQFMAINNMGMVSGKQENKEEVTHKFEDLDDEQLDAAIKAREDRLSRTS